MNGMNPNQLGMGEFVTSFRQLMKRYMQFETHLPMNTSTTLNEVWPFKTGHHDGDQAMLSLYDTLFEYVTFLYRLQVGSMRVLLQPMIGLPDDTPPARVTLMMKEVPTPGPEPNSWFSPIPSTSIPPISSGVPTVDYFPEQEAVLEVDVPFYQTLPMIPTTLGGLAYFDDSMAVPDPNWVPCNSGSRIFVYAGMDLEVSRQIGEDFSFGYLVGPPLSYMTLEVPPPSTENSQE